MKNNSLLLILMAGCLISATSVLAWESFLNPFNIFKSGRNNLDICRNPKNCPLPCKDTVRIPDKDQKKLWVGHTNAQLEKAQKGIFFTGLLASLHCVGDIAYYRYINSQPEPDYYSKHLASACAILTIPLTYLTICQLSNIRRIKSIRDRGVTQQPNIPTELLRTELSKWKETSLVSSPKQPGNFSKDVNHYFWQEYPLKKEGTK